MQFLKSHLKTRDFHFYCQALGEGTVTMSMLTLRFEPEHEAARVYPWAWLAMNFLNLYIYL